MRLSFLIFSLLGTISFSLTTYLERWFRDWSGNRADSANILTVALGDSRRLFAKHFYVKADAYFHSGYYPTIYDAHQTSGKLHIAGEQSGHEEKEVAQFIGPP